MIDKQEFHNEIVDSLVQHQWSKKLTSIMQELAIGVASHRIFRTHYSKQELAAEGILHLLEIWKKYNINDPKVNPFGFFTRCLFRFYGKVLAKEIKYSKLKLALSQYLILNDPEYENDDYYVDYEE